MASLGARNRSRPQLFPLDGRGVLAWLDRQRGLDREDLIGDGGDDQCRCWRGVGAKFEAPKNPGGVSRVSFPSFAPRPERNTGTAYVLKTGWNGETI
jgi:hypothetical protein